MKNRFYLVLLLSFMMTRNVAASEQIEIFVNNKRVDFKSTQPTMSNDRVLVPLRGVFEAINAKVSWIAPSQTIIIEHKNRTVQMQIGLSSMLIADDGEDVKQIMLEVSPVLMQSSAMVPLRAIVDALDGDVTWTNDKKASITFNDTSASNPNPTTLQEQSFTIANKTLNMNASIEDIERELGTPDRIFKDGNNSFYSYINDYENYILLGFNDNKLTMVTSNSRNFQTDSAKIGSSKKDLKPTNYNISENTDETGNVDSIMIKSKKNPAILKADSSSSIKEMELQIFDLTNAMRKKRGKNAHIWSNDLCTISEQHSKDMSDNNYFAHTNLKDQSPFDRMKNIGIDFSSAAENIAYGADGSLSVYNMWLNSEGHRDNMLKDIEQSAAGIYKGTSIYFTQSFATLW